METSRDFPIQNSDWGAKRFVLVLTLNLPDLAQQTPVSLLFILGPSPLHTRRRAGCKPFTAFFFQHHPHAPGFGLLGTLRDLFNSYMLSSMKSHSMFFCLWKMTVTCLTGEIKQILKCVRSTEQKYRFKSDTALLYVGNI